MKSALLILVLLGSFKAHAQSCSQEQVQMAQFLISLKDVGSVHNCNIEVLVQPQTAHKENPDDTFTHIVLFGRDRFRCASDFFTCHESSFEMSVPDRCLQKAQVVNAHHGSWTYQYDLPEAKMRAFIKFQKNRLNQLVQLQIGHTNLDTFKREDYLNCEPDIYKTEAK